MGRMTLDAWIWLVVNIQRGEEPTSEGIENLKMLGKNEKTAATQIQEPGSWKKPFLLKAP